MGDSTHSERMVAAADEHARRVAAYVSACQAVADAAVAVVAIEQAIRQQNEGVNSPVAFGILALPKPGGGSTTIATLSPQITTATAAARSDWPI